MFIDQGFPHLQQEERPAGVKRVCKYFLMLVFSCFMLQKYMVYSLMQNETILFQLLKSFVLLGSKYIVAVFCAFLKAFV